GYNINQIVTEMRMDDNSDTAKLVFRPISFLTEQQWEIARRQGQSLEAKQAVMITPSTIDSDNKTPRLESNSAVSSSPSAKSKSSVEAEDVEVISEPTKRAPKKAAEPAPKKDLASIMSDWAVDDDN
ncbi:MAG: hypothetical protein EBR82_29600, partial [Caulobacteraceae bacterium]|nr:hypothetical protein [Caulobacteraceae bacterium]